MPERHAEPLPSADPRATTPPHTPEPPPAAAPHPALRLLVGALFCAYPLLVWAGVARESPRLVATVLLVLLGPASWWLARQRRPAAERWMLLAPVLTVVALLAAAAFDAALWLFVEPVAISLAFLGLFGSTLQRGRMPMIERFARLQVQDLTEPQRAWCRLWTVLWCGFFVAHATTAGLLVLAPIEWWVFYNTVLFYVAMGCMFASEWLLRRRRFPDA